jgi:flavoprotein
MRYSDTQMCQKCNHKLNPSHMIQNRDGTLILFCFECNKDCPYDSNIMVRV